MRKNQSLGSQHKLEVEELIRQISLKAPRDPFGELELLESLYRSAKMVRIPIFEHTIPHIEKNISARDKSGDDHDRQRMTAQLETVTELLAYPDKEGDSDHGHKEGTVSVDEESSSCFASAFDWIASFFCR